MLVVLDLNFFAKIRKKNETRFVFFSYELWVISYEWCGLGITVLRFRCGEATHNS